MVLVAIGVPNENTCVVSITTKIRVYFILDMMSTLQLKHTNFSQDISFKHLKANKITFQITTQYISNFNLKVYNHKLPFHFSQS